MPIVHDSTIHLEQCSARKNFELPCLVVRDSLVGQRRPSQFLLLPRALLEELQQFPLPRHRLPQRRGHFPPRQVCRSFPSPAHFNVAPRIFFFSLGSVGQRRPAQFLLLLPLLPRGPPRGRRRFRRTSYGALGHYGDGFPCPGGDGFTCRIGLVKAAFGSVLRFRHLGRDVVAPIDGTKYVPPPTFRWIPSKRRRGNIFRCTTSCINIAM